MPNPFLNSEINDLRARGPGAARVYRPMLLSSDNSRPILDGRWIENGSSGTTGLYARISAAFPGTYPERRFAMSFDPIEVPAGKGIILLPTQSVGHAEFTYDPDAQTGDDMLYDYIVEGIENWNGLDPSTLTWANQGTLTRLSLIHI